MTDDDWWQLLSAFLDDATDDMWGERQAVAAYALIYERLSKENP